MSGDKEPLDRIDALKHAVKAALATWVEGNLNLTTAELAMALQELTVEYHFIVGIPREFSIDSLNRIWDGLEG